MPNKSLCFIAQAESVCNYVQQEISRFLTEYLDVQTWCLQKSKVPPSHFMAHSLYIASSSTVMNKILPFIPPERDYFVASRTLNTENLNELLQLEPGTKALVVATNDETCKIALDIIKSLGITYLDLIPYYPGIKQIRAGVNLGITTGLKHLNPPQIERTIDLGVKGVDFSTFARIIQHFGIPIGLLDKISYHYLEALLRITRQQQKTAQMNEVLKKNVEVIINTVNEAIIAVNLTNEISFFNHAAEELFNTSMEEAIGKVAESIVPELDFPLNWQGLRPISGEIKTINGSDYVIKMNPVTDSKGFITGTIATLQPVVEVQELESKVRRALKKKGNIARHTFTGIIGDSLAIRRAVDLAKKFAESDLTILLEGESGTGKELFAQAIHNQSKRKNSSFVALNFAALTENLVESELFGYEDGAFTGARKGGKQGLFEEAHTGTIFLDEIGDASPELQKKLLRVLEEREIRRVGGSTVTPVDVRIIAATNCNLESLVKEGKFRSDLFYRLCALPISLPPLRERKEDILLLFKLISRRTTKEELSLKPLLTEFLINYNWPGNVRELENVAKYIISVAGSKGTADIEDLPPYLIRIKEGHSNTHISNTSKQRVDVSLNESKENLNSFLYNEIDKESNEFVATLRAFEREKSLPIIFTLLSEIKNKTLLNKGLGRNNLLRALQGTKHEVTEYRVKQCLLTLEHMGYIQSGITRQGSRITEKGENFLSYISCHK